MAPEGVPPGNSLREIPLALDTLAALGFGSEGRRHTIYYTCGCNRPFDNMGDEHNITEHDFEAAAATDAGKHESVAEAKRHMLSLLQQELQGNELDLPREQY